MKNIQKYIVPRGKRGIYYLRRRIPSPRRRSTFAAFDLRSGAAYTRSEILHQE